MLCLGPEETAYVVVSGSACWFWFLCRVCQEGTHAEVTGVSLANVAKNENVITVATLGGKNNNVEYFFFYLVCFVSTIKSKNETMTELSFLITVVCSYKPDVSGNNSTNEPPMSNFEISSA